MSGTTWLDGAITVNRAPWPVLTMDWIDGRTLNEYVDFLVAGSNTAALTTLAGRWRELVALLQRSEFAHGDLQHGNVMVDQDGQLRLVDFDGVWIPQLAGQSPPTEFGHPNYQHPLHHDWDRWLDTFSALVIYLSLVALGKDPGLWLALYNSKNLLFAKTDFFPPFKTEAWKQLAALGDPQVDELARKLQECCDPLWMSDRSLEATLAQPAVAPALPAVPADQRWWEQHPAPGPGTAAPGNRAPGNPPGSGPGVAVPALAAADPAASPRRPRRRRHGPGPAPAPRGAAGAALPAPPPLSAPLGMAGTGPMPQLSQRWCRPATPSGGPCRRPARPRVRPAPGPGYRVRAARAHAPRVRAPRAGADPAGTPRCRDRPPRRTGRRRGRRSARSRSPSASCCWSSARPATSPSS